jgi:hypothetical protein
MSDVVATPNAAELRIGRRVEVRNRFDQRWTGGFEVAEAKPEGYVLRRLSDGAVLPATFPPEDVRRERRQGMWWA